MNLSIINKNRKNSPAFSKCDYTLYLKSEGHSHTYTVGRIFLTLIYRKEIRYFYLDNEI